MAPESNNLMEQRTPAPRLDARQAQHIAQRTAFLAALWAFVFTVAKLLLFFLTGSLVIALSAWDSLIDTIVSLVNRKIVAIARQEADENHPYGHGRAESLAALGQGGLILGGGLIIVFSSIKSLYYLLAKPAGTPATLPPISHISYVVFFVVAAAISYLIALWIKRQGEVLHSPALLADSQHYHIDFLANIATAAATGLILLFKNPFLDPAIALLSALYIIYKSIHMLAASVQELMDHAIPDHIKSHVVQLIHDANHLVVDVHKLRGRRVGHRYYFDCHVTLPKTLTFPEVHEIIEQLEFILLQSYDGDMVIHADPL